MNLAHLVWDAPSQTQTVIICLKILRPELPITRHTTLKTNGKKKKETTASHFYCLSRRTGPMSVCMCVWQKYRARKRDWNETILPLCQIRLEHSCHFTPPILFEGLRKGNLVLLQAPWGVKTLWCELSPDQFNDWIPPRLCMWMLWEYLPLYLTRLGIFIIPP